MHATVQTQPLTENQVRPHVRRLLKGATFEPLPKTHHILACVGGISAEGATRKASRRQLKLELKHRLRYGKLQ